MKDRIAAIIREYDEQGVHRTGTDVDNVSAAWMASRMNAMGVRAELDEMRFERVEIVDARLQSTDLALPGVPLFDGGFTTPQGVSGALGKLGSRAEIGVLMLMPYNQGPAYEALEHARRTNMHAAIVAVTDSRWPQDGIATLNAEDFGAPFGPPVLQVANAAWPRLEAAMAKGERATVFAHCEQVAAVARNVQARVPGSHPALAPVVVMTPRSGWWHCASERGGGIAAFLEIIRAVTAAGVQRDVVFTANTGHELGHTGLDHYLARNEGLIAGASMWLHLGANFAAAVGGGVRLQYSDARARELAASVLQASGLQPATETPPGTRPAGEARNVFDGGGRYISILGGNGLFHHPRDRWPQAVDLESTTRWVEALASLTVQLAGEAVR